MNTDNGNLKALLHESIENIDDEDVLRVVKDFLDRKYTPGSAISFTDEQSNASTRQSRALIGEIFSQMNRPMNS